MLLTATTHFHFHFHFHTFPSPSPSPSPSQSSSHIFPPQLPKTKTKFLIRCSNTKTRTRRSSAIERIAEKLRSLGITEPPPSSGSEIHVPFPHELPKRRVGHTFEPSWSTPLNPVPVPGTGIAALSASEVARRRKLREEKLERRKESVPTLAELSLPDSEIRRLTTLGFETKKKVRLAKAGVTERIVNVIHERWKNSEVVRVVCEEFSRVDLRRTHDLLERKTGGLVVWRSGTKIILYRGTDYKYPYSLSDEVLRQDNPTDYALQHVNGDDKYCHKSQRHLAETNSAISAVDNSNVETAKPALLLGVGTHNKVRFQLPDEAELAEDTYCLLTGLGPRFSDWWGCDPLPVDADLLPSIVHGYRKPFRLLPYGVNPKLTNDEMTSLKRLGRPLPCHFALGRNRNLQGLAAAIIKLWERCEIVKIAVKRGVQNTSSKIMAKELKHLTGGILLSRDREFIVFYRGKDYLPAAVSSAIKKQRNFEMYKLKAGNSLSTAVTPDQKDGIIECDSEVKDMSIQKDTKQQMLSKAEVAIKRTSIKLSMALEKKSKAEKRLEVLLNAESPQEQEMDKEGITKEEKYMLRRIGLTMKPFLLLGRRGVFDGTVENIHLHWKYRELVKIICNGSLEDVHQIALTLEAESGGILVAVERVRKGFAIIVYRGKNYSVPACLRPQTLLNKRQALKRSIQAQRRESLKLRILMLDKKINELKLQMVEDMEANSNHIAETLRFDRVQPVELIDKGGTCQGEPENSINWNYPREASVDNQQAIQEQPVAPIETSEVHPGELENSINWNSPTEASIDNQQAIQEQPVELFDGGGAHKNELESRPSLTHEETQLNEVKDPVADAEHCISNSRAMKSSNSSSKNGPEPSSSVINMSLPSRSVHLSTKERLLLRKQALKFKQPVLAIGKSNIVSSVVKTIKAHFEKYPLAVVNVKGRAKGTSVQELIFKLEQETGALLVSREPSNLVLYRGWPAEKPSLAINVNEEGTKPSVSSAYTRRIRNRKRRIGMIGKRRISSRIGKGRICRTEGRNFTFRRDATPIFSACS